MLLRKKQFAVKGSKVVIFNPLNKTSKIDAP